MEQDKVTIQQASDRLKINRKTIYRWIERGLVSRVREGNRAYVSMAEVKAQYDKEHSRNTGNVTGNMTGINTITLDREHYEGLLIRLGQLESEKRYLLEYKSGVEDKDRELDRLRTEVERLKIPWYRRWFRKD